MPWRSATRRTRTPRRTARPLAVQAAARSCLVAAALAPPPTLVRPPAASATTHRWQAAMPLPPVPWLRE